MKDVKVLGPGCARCQATADLVRDQATKLGVEIRLEKISDYAAIAGFGIASTPGVVVDGKLMHAGGLPRTADIEKWLTAEPN